MLPATYALPKEMLPVAGKPLIQYAVEEAVASGIETIVLATRNHKSMIQSHFSRNPALERFLESRTLSRETALIRNLSRLARIRCVQQNEPLGLGHAISCARPIVGNKPFAVLLPDVILEGTEPATRQMIRAHAEHGESILAIREVAIEDVHRHGIVRIERSATAPDKKFLRVTALVEKPAAECAPSRFAIIGRYLLDHFIWDSIAHTPPDIKGEIQITGALNLLCKKRSVYGLCVDGGHFDAGDKLGFLKANIELSLRDPQLRQFLRDYLSNLQLQRSCKHLTFHPAV